MVEPGRYESDSVETSDVDTRHLDDPESLEPRVDVEGVKIRSEDNGLSKTVVATRVTRRGRAVKTALPGSDVPGDDLVTGSNLPLGDVDGDELDRERYRNPEEYPRYTGERQDFGDLDDGDGGAVINRLDSDAEHTHVRGRVVQADDTTLLLADESGTAVIDMPASLDRPELHAGEEVVLTNVEQAGDGPVKWEPSLDTDVVAIRRHKAPAGCWMERKSELVNAGDWYDDSEDYNARSQVAKTLIDEHWIETPLGNDEDELVMYVDAPDVDPEDPMDPDAGLHGTWVGGADDATAAGRIDSILNEHLPPRKNTDPEKDKIRSIIRDSTRVPSDKWQHGESDDADLRWTTAVQNGVIDLRTGELHDHGPEWQARHKLPVEYHPAEYDDGLGEGLDWFIGETMDTDSDREAFRYMVGHALARCYPSESIFPIIGPGRNGKTVLLKVVRELFGAAIGDFDLAVAAGDSDFGGGPVKGSHIVLDDDATGVELRDSNLLKKLSGGSKAQVNQKHDKMDGDGYDNYATIIYLANDPPMWADKSVGCRRRMVPVIMPYKFTSDPSDDNKDSIPEEELLYRIKTEEEVEALLVEAVKYAGKIHEDGKVEDGRTEDERADLYDKYSDGIMQFWQSCMTEEPGARVGKNAVYGVYSQWCDARGIKAQQPGGSRGFWPLSKTSPAVSFNADGVWVGDDRAVEHVTFAPEAMDHAPEWVSEKWEADVDDDESTLANRLDRVTPLADLDDGFCTTQARVIARGYVDEYEKEKVQLTLEDDTTAMHAVCTGDEFDGVNVGDVVRLTRAVMSAQYGVPKIRPSGCMEVDVVEEGPLSEPESESEDTEDAVDADSVEGEILDAINSRDGRCEIDDVHRAVDHNRMTVEESIDSLKMDGKVYEPATGEIKST